MLERYNGQSVSRFTDLLFNVLNASILQLELLA
jgi:hypothetical protein